MTDERWRTDTAERPAVVEPATAQPPPSPPQSQSQSPGRRAAPAGMPPASPPDRSGPVRRAPRPPAPAWIAWVVVAAVLVTAAFVGAWLAVRDPGTTRATDPAPAESTDAPADEPSEPASADPEEPKAEKEPKEEPAPEEPVGDPVDLAPASVTVPRAAPANNDVTGELVTFVADNMLDGDITTCWRMAGDASGNVLTFTFDRPVTVSSVGMINGYAKSSLDDSGQAFDWYQGNRRVLGAEWVIGDQTYPQTLGETTEIQSIDVEPTETTTVELRLVLVGPPATGPNGRDYTAISEVSFAGNES